MTKLIIAAAIAAALSLGTVAHDASGNAATPTPAQKRDDACDTLAKLSLAWHKEPYITDALKALATMGCVKGAGGAWRRAAPVAPAADPAAAADIEAACLDAGYIPDDGSCDADTCDSGA